MKVLNFYKSVNYDNLSKEELLRLVMLDMNKSENPNTMLLKALFDKTETQWLKSIILDMIKLNQQLI